MGALLTVALIPNLIFSLHAGVWVDRRGRRRQVMLATDVGRGVLIATVPVAYAFGHLTWAQLYVVAFLSGTLSVFFFVAYGAFFQVVVPREDYVAANSLIHGSRAFSFLAGTSLGGVLVQLLRGPYALALDAVSYIWSAFFLGRIDARGAARRAARVRRPAVRRQLDPPQRDHPRRAARRRDAQPLQLHVLRAVPALRDARPRRAPGDARHRARRRVDRHARRFVRDGPRLAADRRRPDVHRRLLPLPRAADPRPGRRWPALARARDAVRLRVPVGRRPDAARHHGGHDQRGHGPDARCARASPARSWS